MLFYNQLKLTSGQLSDQTCNSESDLIMHVCGDNLLAALAFTVMISNAQAVIHCGHAKLMLSR